MINSRSLDDLLPVVKTYAESFLSACMAQGYEVRVTSTYRDDEYQNALYAQGRTHPGKIVTDAQGGFSFHQYHVAFDWAVFVNGQPDWTDAKYDVCGQIAESVGLEWAGRWTSFTEKDHCQYTGGLALADLRAGQVPA